MGQRNSFPVPRTLMSDTSAASGGARKYYIKYNNLLDRTRGINRLEGRGGRGSAEGRRFRHGPALARVDRGQVGFRPLVSNKSNYILSNLNSAPRGD